MLITETKKIGIDIQANLEMNDVSLIQLSQDVSSHGHVKKN